VINTWTWYRDFRFEANQTNFRASETNKLSEIAFYLKANPSLKVGIDGSMEPRNQDLSDQHVKTVRDALINAGVPKSRIEVGTFGDSKVTRDGRVAILVRTAN
jgi:outer membrane protein OmpA-like peptidoglycan-associated protein